MRTKDFSILLEKVSTTNAKKDLAYVDGTNSIVQQIENVLKTNKGENVSNINFGANVKDYAYDTAVNRQIITSTLRSVIKSSIRKIFDVSVNVTYYSDTVIVFDVQFSTEVSMNQQNKSSCQIEIPLS